MYPVFRLAKELLVFRKAPSLAVLDTHVSHHVCWPWDIDPWLELNNGRTLTLYDLGRLPFARRAGIGRVMKAKRWGMAVAGASVRYRRRVRAFDRVEMHTRALGWDCRFIYMEQSMWRGGDCTSQALLRLAITDAGGIVAPVKLVEALGAAQESPELPRWVRAWIEAEAERPWPPPAAPEKGQEAGRDRAA
ncbi:acyl-CoA thioesterase [Acidimangrovimonas pyrenivorans]|uniref:Acyl-CoA thioesterase n=1 Tax=Acidimangrovimonas pyrenivorans TaxID=2030798 RepID=A0ABV7ACW6_9RHOB